MTSEKIIEFNKLCAEFLGFKCSINEQYELPNMMTFPPKKGYNLCYTAKVCNVEDMQFHTDWNWIMEVIDKMEEISSCTIMERKIKGSFEINAYSITYYYGPEQNNLLQLQLKPFISAEDWTHSMYKKHIIKRFDFQNKSKLEAVVYAIYIFLTWYNKPDKN